MKDLIIIGSGPAGLSAAVYAMRAGLDTLVLEKNPISGGQIINTYEVDNYLGLPGMNGFDMAMKFREHADSQGAEFVNANVISIEMHDEASRTFSIKTDSETYETKAVIIASGASHRQLGVKGESELAGRGVSYCATCDGAFFRGKTAVVAGGGDVAVEDAIFLARGCSKVYLIHRRNKLRATAILQKELMSLDNVEIVWDSTVTAINGENAVSSVSIRNVNDDSGRQIQTDACFIAVGIHPESENFQNFVNCDKDGYILAGEDAVTSVQGIFAAGDVRTKRLRQIVTAVSDGANAVHSAGEYISKYV